MTQALLSLTAVSKKYLLENEEVHALCDVSLDIRKGEFVSIVGHSGSGKTTLLSVMGGMVHPTSGRVLVEGEELYSLDPDGLARHRREKTGFMFQFSSLLPVLTVIENVLFPAVLGGEVTAKVEGWAKELLDKVGLADKMQALPAQLSGGQQRRVAIARAFVNHPQIILADEPTGDLDEETEQEIMDMFLAMNRDLGTTFVIVTHNTELARQTPRICRMTKGLLQAA